MLQTWVQQREVKLGSLIVQEGLHVGLRRAIQGPLYITFQLRLLQASKADLAHLLALGPVISQALQAQCRIVSSPGQGVLVEVPLPDSLRRTPSAISLARLSNGLALAVGLSSQREPVILDFERQPHLLLVGPSGRGKSQALRSLLFALASKNSPRKALFLVLAKKTEDWQGFSGTASCLGVIIQPQEQAQAVSWLSRIMEARTAQGVKKPHIFLVADDLINLTAKADIQASLGEIASLGRGAGLHVIISTQTTGKAGGLSQEIEQNITARLIFGAGDGAAGARYAGQAGLRLEAVGICPGDSLLVLDGQPARLASGLCPESALASLPVGIGQNKPWGQEQAGTSQNRPPGIPTQEPSGEIEGEAQEQEQGQAQRLDSRRAPTAEERAYIRQMREEYVSIHRTTLACYGFYNGKVRRYVLEALQGDEA
jgi:energy-coupling factor transporter ATP-binding protein EcfA2